MEFVDAFQILNSKFHISRRVLLGEEQHVAPVVSRRHVMKVGLASAGAPALARALGVSAAAQDVGPAKGKLGVMASRARQSSLRLRS